MVALLFEEPSATRITPLRATEPRVNWYRRITRPEAVEARRVVNDMYSRFPDPDATLRRRLRSRNDADLRAALDELLVHDVLSRRYRVVYEPSAQSSTSPDFLLFDKADHIATVEVYSLMLRGEWQEERLRHGRIEDHLNQRLQPTTHFVDLDVKSWDDHSDLDHVLDWVSRTLEALHADPSALPIGYLGLPESTYTHGSARIDFHFWQAPDDYTPKDGDRIVTGGAAIGGWINSALRLRRKLNRKAEKYDLSGKPFAIVVGMADPMCDLDDVLNALVGDPAVVVATGRSTREKNGVYGLRTNSAAGPRRPGLSAVFALQDWNPGGPYRPDSSASTTRWLRPRSPPMHCLLTATGA